MPPISIAPPKPEGVVQQAFAPVTVKVAITDNGDTVNNVVIAR